MWAVSLLTGQGYTPEPPDLEQLIDIDSKMRRLLPAEQFLSVQCSYTSFSELQVCFHQRHSSAFSQKAIRHHPVLLSDEVIRGSAQWGINGNVL